MTSSASHLRSMDFQSSKSFESLVCDGVKFTVRRMTLRQRISLLNELHTLYREREFNSAGGSKADEIKAQISNLLIDEVFLRWGVVAIDGLYVDGKPLCVDELAEKAPERLVSEILGRLRECITLTPDEEKN